MVAQERQCQLVESSISPQARSHALEGQCINAAAVLGVNNIQVLIEHSSQSTISMVHMLHYMVVCEAPRSMLLHSHDLQERCIHTAALFLSNLLPIASLVLVQ